MCGTTRPAGAGMMNIVSLCNESCLTSPPDKQVLWCGRGRHVGSNLVTIHHNRMWQTADKRHNLVTQTTFWSCSISKQVLNSKFQILCLYTHAPLAFKVVLPTTGFRNSNSFICIPRIPFLAQNCPPKCVFLNVTLYTFCVYVCVCVCVWLVSILNTDGGPCSASQNHNYVKNSWCHPRQHSIIQWESLLTVLCVCDTLIKQ